MTTVHHATTLTGGGTGALDAKATSTLADGDIAFTSNSGALFWHRFNASGTAAENSPTVIRPDDYSTAGVWELQAPSINTATVGRREIVGGDMVVAATVSPCNCWDSTGTVFLETTATQGSIPWGVEPANWSGVNKLIDIYLCRKISDGTCEFRMYLNGVDTPSDDIEIDAYRWIDYAVGTEKTAIYTDVLSFITTGGYHLCTVASENILSSSIGTTYGTPIDHSSYLPTDHIAAIEYGCRDGATAATILASEDGTNVSFVVGTTVTTASDTNLDAWGAAAAQKAGLKPFFTERRFKSTSGTLDLLIHQVLLKR